MLPMLLSFLPGAQRLNKMGEPAILELAALVREVDSPLGKHGGQSHEQLCHLSGRTAQRADL
jgi:hypothetical protein